MPETMAGPSPSGIAGGDVPAYAVLSCDLDTVDRHLQGYGCGELPACDLIYRTAVPRLLDLLAEQGQRCVFFVIARDAPAQSRLLRRIVALGHEVASHSLTHPQPFSSLDPAALRREIFESRERLRDATGSEIYGFRAPAWDVNDRVLDLVSSAGYSYDASIFPTPLLAASRLMAYSKSESMSEIFSMGVLGHVFARRQPHQLKATRLPLVEFPIAVTRSLRLPVYHTMTYLVPGWTFRRWLRSVLRSGSPLGYEFHAADLFDLVADGVDSRMARHPGMNLPGLEKVRRLGEILREIGQARPVCTYRQALENRLAA